MDKYKEIICKQNPTMKLPCGNKKCKTEFTVKTIDLCKSKTYSHICEKCGETTDYIAEKLFDKVIKELKAWGIK